MSYNIIQIDPRPAQKDAMIELLQKNAPVIGIEFTLPALVPFIEYNLDDQHVEGSTGRAAIELAMEMPLPLQNVTFAIVRPDPDALGAIAVLNLRTLGAANIDLSRIDYIASQDTFDHGTWPGPSPIVIKEENDFTTLGALAQNFKIPIEERVKRFEQWLLFGHYEGMDEDKRKRMESFRNAVEETTIRVIAGNIAFIKSHHIGATAVGYHYAPILVIKNDAFSFNGGPVHKKYTICTFEKGYVNFQRLTAALNEQETAGTWGGGPTILGSPQGASTKLSEKTIIDKVKQNRMIVVE